MSGKRVSIPPRIVLREARERLPKETWIVVLGMELGNIKRGRVWVRET